MLKYNVYAEISRGKELIVEANNPDEAYEKTLELFDSGSLLEDVKRVTSLMLI